MSIGEPIPVGREARAARAEDDVDLGPLPDADGITLRTYGIGGTALSALESGPEDGEVVVLLHGIPASAELWRDVIVRLAAAGKRVVAFDLPGYGHTLHPARADHSLAGAAELVSRWIAVTVGGPVWVVGHDLGGAVAQILASRHPTRLSRLTLTDTVVEDSWPVAPVQRLQLLLRLGLFPRLAGTPLFPRGMFRRELARGFADEKRLTDEVARRVFFDSKLDDPDGRRAFARHVASLDNQQTQTISGGLPRLPFPVQLVWGEQDVFQPFDDVGERLAARLPEPHVTLVADAGHFLPLERPQAFVEAMLGWESGESGDDRG